LNHSPSPERKIELLCIIREFVGRSAGLRPANCAQTETIVLKQAVDGKALAITAASHDDVLLRVGADGQDFIQVNFSSGRKILLTSSLIGFKPAQMAGLSPARLPKVVTTPDIVSVFEAIQEALHASESDSPGAHEDLILLRRVFEAVVSGGEEAGFDLATERGWLGRIPTTPCRATA
jgi:hypothetical protein